MKIEIYPSKALSRIAEEVDIEKLSLYKELIKNMIDTMQRNKGQGLAAPQVDVNKRIIVFFDEEKNSHVLINPEIIESRGKIITEEGCLSCPNYKGRIKRKRVIDVKAIDENGKELSITLTNMDAVIVQHEMDHLEGITILSNKKQRKKK